MYMQNITDDEKELIQGLIDGDQDSYAKLINSYGGRMLAVARRFLRVNEDAQDCVQESFLLIFRKINTFENRSSLWSWMHRIVANQCLMKLRSRKNIPQHEEITEELSPEFDSNGRRAEPAWVFEGSAEELLSQKRTKDIVLESVGNLPESYRIVLMLRDIEEYSTEETAEALGVSIGAVKTRLHRARAALKILLEPIFNIKDKEVA